MPHSTLKHNQRSSGRRRGEKSQSGNRPAISPLAKNNLAKTIPERSPTEADSSALAIIPDTTADLRQKYRKKLRKKPRYRLQRSLLLLGLLAAMGGAGWYSLESSLPDTASLETATKTRLGTMEYVDGTGQTFFQAGPATRNYVEFNQIPKQLKEAFLATEDRRFYEHDGVDLWGVIRATGRNLLTRDFTEGGSTITQQLARISYLDQERSILRKLREARVSQKIEATLSKDEILGRYLNQVYLGSGAYGVADAARVYFGKKLNELTLPEIATLAGLPAAPSVYSPLVDPEVAKERRNLVLLRMEQAKFITPEEAKAAKAAPMQVQEQAAPNLEDKAPYFTAYIQSELERLISPADLQAGGLTVETTLNLPWQTAATQTIQDTVYNQGWGQQFDQGALVSMDPSTGEIKTMVGGANFQESQFNRATQAQRQPGSTFKAFVYTAAIATGILPSDGYLDAPIVVDGYRPKNYSNGYRGWVSMSTALTHSLNIPAVRLLMDVGFKPTIDLAHSMGISSKLEPVYSTALGSNEVNLLELTNGYSTLASEGVHFTPYGIRRVRDRQGRIIYDNTVTKKQVVDADSAAIMTWMLEKVIISGTGTNAKLDRPVAGKTGTSEDYRDLWFVGYIPQLVTGVWFGNDDNYPTQGTSATAAQAWHDYMVQVTKEMPVKAFPAVPSFENHKSTLKAEPVNPKSLTTENIPSAASENATPTQPDNASSAETENNLAVTESTDNLNGEDSAAN